MTATMEMKHAVLPLRVDRKGGKPAVTGRTFSGMASTRDLDLGGDIVEPMAFSAWLADWKKTGRTLPLIDSHDPSSVLRVVGKMTDARITDRGLWTKWQIIDTPTGREILARVAGGYVDGLSIGYQVVDAEPVEGGIRRITAIELREVSLVVWPMNPAARVETRGLRPGDPRRVKAEAHLRDYRVHRIVRRTHSYSLF